MLIRPAARCLLASAVALAVAAPLTLAAAPATAATAFPTLTPTALVERDFTLYAANAGATETESIGAGAHLGLYQSRTDQPYGTDDATGGSWGYVADDRSNPRPNDSTGDDPWTSLRYDEEPAGSDLATRQVSYDFDLPAGTYDVTFGFDVPDGWGGRTVVTRAEGADLERFDTGTARLTKSYAVTIDDGTLNLAVGSPAGRTGKDADPLVNLVTVKAQPDWTDFDLLGAKVDQTTLTAEQEAGYAPPTVRDLDDAHAAAQRLIDAESDDAAANRAAFEAIAAAYAKLRKISSYDSFRPGEPWTDDQGRLIQAHGGQVVPAEDEDGQRIYYWYGEDRSNGYWDSPGVHVYSSTDLYNWTDRGLALRSMKTEDQFETDPYFQDLYGDYSATEKKAVFRDLGTSQITAGVNPAILERPKVIYNKSTKKWVMWIHTDGPSATSNAQYAKATAGVATSDSPFGPFRYIDSYRLHVAPEGEPNYQPSSPGMARDMNLFLDDDGTAYIIYSSEENYSLFISKLNADFTQLATPAASAVKGVDFTRPYIGAHREAPAIFKYDGTYYLITSGATGWNPNPAAWATATDILGPWTDHGNPVTGDGAATTCRSQSTSMIPVDPAKGRFIYMGDRWTPSDLASAPYVWLPVTFGEGGSISLTCRDEWKLDDLPAYEKWSVATTLPKQMWLGDVDSLPTKVEVTTPTGTKTEAVTWDPAGLSRPGASSVTGTLSDGRTFTRSTVVVPRGLRYVANAGGFETADYRTIVEAATTERALLNSVPDQDLGADPGTGSRWGLTGSTGTFGNDTGDIYTTGRYAKDGSALTYEFGGLAPGKYQVHAGYYDPWPAANRAGKVTINGEVKETTQLFTAERVNVTYRDVEVGADGRLTYSISKTRSPDIQLSYVMVARPKAAQTITFGALPDVATDDPAFQLTATASSGLPVSYTASGACTVTGGKLTLTGAVGTCSVTATQGGDDDHSAAAPVSRRFTVSSAESNLLDSFDRARGPVGRSWTGATSEAFYRIKAEQLRVKLGGPLLWRAPFGADQEASYTLASIDSRSRSVGVLLKTQSSWGFAGGAIRAAYDPRRAAVRVSTVRSGARGWTSYPTARVRYRAGDEFGARAAADGMVTILRNGKAVDRVLLNRADTAYFRSKGGRVGVWAAGAPRVRIDDVRGGSLG